MIFKINLKRIASFSMALIVMLVFTACKSEVADENVENTGITNGESDTIELSETEIETLTEKIYELDDNGEYTPQEGDCYIGITFIKAEGNSMELYAVCNGDVVIDCGTAVFLPSFKKEDYIGKTYEQAFIDFYNNNIADFIEDGKITEIGSVLVMDAKPDNCDEVFERIRAATVPDAKLGSGPEGKDSFLDRISSMTERYVSEQEFGTAEMERQEAEQQAQRELNLLESTPAYSVEDIEKRLDAGISRMELGDDVAIDVSSIDLAGTDIDCCGHSLSIKGTWNSGTKGFIMGTRVHGASYLDLSGLIIPDALLASDELIGLCYDFVSFEDIDPANVVFPDGIPFRQDFYEGSPFEGFLCIDIVKGENRGSVRYEGPRTTYEEQNEKDEATVFSILTAGDAGEINEDGHFVEYEIWSDVEIDIGNSVLPNQDYAGIKLMPGAHLTITGTLTVTGGRPDWRVSEYDQLDITGLTIIKSHPSPDVLKIRFNPEQGLNTASCTPKAGAGTLMTSLGSDSFDITIW